MLKLRVKSKRKKRDPGAGIDWVTFVKISEANVLDKPLALDANWCAARGVNPSDEIVLQLLRDVVSPFISYLKRRRGLERWHFLVHDRASGVPTTEDDKGAYLHLRLVFKHSINLNEKENLLSEPTRPLPGQVSFFPPVWHRFEMTRKVEGRTTEIGGIDLDLIKNRDVTWAWKFIDRQSEMVLEFINAHDWNKQDTGAMVRQTLQFWHYFSNMLQMNFR